MKPFPDEYPEYYNLYINLIKEGDIIKILEEQSSKSQEFMASIPVDLADSTYGFGKWTIKEVLGHMIDTERIFSYRALRIARQDKQALSGYDQDDYIKNSNYFKRTIADIAEEMLFLRCADIKMFRGFSEHDLMQRGIADDKEFSVNALLYIIAGHEMYHIKFIKENYLTK